MIMCRKYYEFLFLKNKKLGKKTGLRKTQLILFKCVGLLIGPLAVTLNDILKLVKLTNFGILKQIK